MGTVPKNVVKAVVKPQAAIAKAFIAPQVKAVSAVVKPVVAAVVPSVVKPVAETTGEVVKPLIEGLVGAPETASALTKPDAATAAATTAVTNVNATNTPTNLPTAADLKTQDTERKIRGRVSTLLTSPVGALDEPYVAKKRLLGA